MDAHIARPPTPQAMVHRLPDKSDDTALDFDSKPSKFIIIVVASTAVAGKLQVAKTVSSALACPLFQGDSLHESAAKAASVGADVSGGHNENRYQRMWLSKMTRTGLLFPHESRPAAAGFSGFGGSSSTTTSRRGSASSDASDFSASDTASLASSVVATGGSKFVNKPPIAAFSREGVQGKGNSALLVLTHPKLERWQKACIRSAVGEYAIGVIFVPLDQGDEEEEDDLPILRPLDPSRMTSFSLRKQTRDWSEEIVVKVDVDARVDDLAQEVLDEVRCVMAEE